MILNLTIWTLGPTLKLGEKISSFCLAESRNPLCMKNTMNLLHLPHSNLLNDYDVCVNKICAFYLQKVSVPWCVLKEIIEIYGFIFLSNAICLLFGSFPDRVKEMSWHSPGETSNSAEIWRVCLTSQPHQGLQWTNHHIQGLGVGVKLGVVMHWNWVRALHTFRLDLDIYGKWAGIAQSV
jgi:hypothetical protein